MSTAAHCPKTFTSAKKRLGEKGFSYSLVAICKSIANSGAVPEKSQAAELFAVLENIVKELAMNEFEATLMSIYLERFGWKDSEFAGEDAILFCGLQAKSHLNMGVEGILSQLEEKYQGFEAMYQKWTRKHRKDEKVDAKEINLQFMAFQEIEEKKAKRKVLDYNVCVDQILQGTVSYNIDNSMKERSYPLKKKTKVQKRHKKEKSSIEKDAELLTHIKLTGGLKRNRNKTEFSKASQTFAPVLLLQDWAHGNDVNGRDCSEVEGEVGISNKQFLKELMLGHERNEHGHSEVGNGHIRLMSFVCEEKSGVWVPKLDHGMRLKH
jgi:hypothetical protein